MGVSNEAVSEPIRHGATVFMKAVEWYGKDTLTFINLDLSVLTELNLERFCRSKLFAHSRLYLLALTDSATLLLQRKLGS